ncbi:hypothetical protein [Streptomyces sp. B1I3]|uniref:hypothetical protein n=1 Tax=Streptomyces sp. B1I3 TaxID=3042264 RepID=UPI002780DB7A|nr:hypothetical protein [Streptomyces sp. B1I3]MDQ0794809.1 hypothetical protein [Streptomyces sp. B1I3]
MSAVSFFFFVVAVLGLFFLGVPFLLQAPLRKRGVRVMASESRRTFPKDGKIDVQYVYVDADGELHTSWRFGQSMEPEALTEVVYDPNKPKRSEFSDLMPENVQRRRIVLLCLTAVAVVMLMLMAVGALL